MRAILTLGASLLNLLTVTAALHPPGGQAGTSVQVLATGKHEDWPPTFWTSREGLNIEALEKSGQLKVTISKDAAPGPVLVRLLAKKEVSPAHIFVISQQPETLEAEPNNNLAEAQTLETLPALLNGRLHKKGDTDFYHLHLEKGQTLSARLDGYSLRSPIDAFLHILDPRGYETAVASDSHNLDPHLLYTARHTGRHSLQILAITAKASTSIQYAGDENAVYRLQLDIDKAATAPPIADHAETDAPDPLLVPSTLAGTFNQPGETDTYQLKLPKGTSAHIRIEARSLHYPTDSVLAVYNGEKLLREIDDEDRTSPDAGYLLKSSTDTPYTLQIRERYGKAGKPYRYRLSLTQPQPTIAPTVDKDIQKATPEKELKIKINLNRKNGHKQPLRIKITGLPEPLCIDGLNIPADTKDATLSLTAHDDTPTGHHPFQIHILDTEDKSKVLPATFSFQTSESRGDYLLNETTWLWLSLPPAEPKPDNDKK